MAVTQLQKRIYTNGAICGVALAFLILLLDWVGVLTPIENALYDLRARTCQLFTPEPTSDIVYLDIDDDALELIQRWPWDRERVAAVLDELKHANPKVVALDVIFSEPQADRLEMTPDGQVQVFEQDGALARAIGNLGNVVLGTSFNVIPAPDARARVRNSAIEVLSEDIRLDGKQLFGKLTFSARERDASQLQIESEFPNIRREAIRQAVRQVWTNGHDTLPNIKSALLGPSTTQPAGAASTESLERIIGQEYERVRSERILEKSMITPPAGLSLLPPDATYNLIPIPAFCEAMSASGFTDNRLFTDPVVRSMVLFVRVNGRFYPQLALVTACRLLDVDLQKIVITDSSVTLPSPKGNYRIPVRPVKSETMGRSVGYVMDIPWYGKRDWETMNDWPANQKSVQHYPIDSVWSVAEISRAIRQNEKTVDECLKYFYEVDSSFKHDAPDRMATVALVQKDFTEFGYDEYLKANPGTLSDKEKLTVRYMKALNEAAASISKQMPELKKWREQMAQRFAGKAVLIGATATATGDFVSTSLHSQCPGVVVHGVIANAIVNRDFLTASPQWLNLLLVLFAGLIATAVTCVLPPARAVLILILICAAYFTANGLLFYDRLNGIVDAGRPLVAMFVCWGGVLTVRTIVETLERIRLNQEAAVIDHEIELARQVQKGLIPKELQVLDNVDSHGWTKAATTTGGDCFDLWKLKDGRMGILVGDASGHGLGPSLVVSQVRALVRSMCDLFEQPQDLLNAVNTRLYEDLDGRKFCTCFLGFLSEDGKLAWASAGHGPMLWAPTIDAPIEEINGTALPLGVNDDPGADEFIPVLELGETGWLAVTSDGIFEAGDPTGEQYGVERITAAIRSAEKGSSADVVDALRKSVDIWQAKPIPDDDQTIVFLRRKAITVPETQN